jgi:hypothetical protein
MCTKVGYSSDFEGLELKKALVDQVGANKNESEPRRGGMIILGLNARFRGLRTGTPPFFHRPF